MVRDRRRREVRARATLAAEERLLDALVGQNAQATTRDAFRKKLRAGELQDKDIELDLADTGGPQMIEIPGQPGGAGMA